MRVCLFGTFEANYPRNQILTKALQKAGAEIIECHSELWDNQADKSGLFKDPLTLLKIFTKMLFIYPMLLLRYLFAPAHDVIWIGYPGHIDVLVIKWLAKLKHKPIVFDAFISLSEAVVEDRKLVGSTSLISKMLAGIDKTICAWSERVLLDTNAQIDYFAGRFAIPKDKFRRILAGADDEIFKPKDNYRENQNEYRVLFIGKFSPLHGIETIVQAAQILAAEDSGIKFDLIGTGQLFEKMRDHVSQRKLTNVTLRGWVAYEKLADEIHRSDLCLGIFSASPKADRVIPNKAFHALACQKPVITADTEACKELLTHLESVYFVKPEDPGALAEGILYLKNNPKVAAGIALRGHEIYRTSANLNAESLQVSEILSTVFVS